MDNKEINCLVLLDLSAAFDTIKIDYLLNRLCYHFGTTGTALKWFEEYLTDRKQEVIIPDRTKHNNSHCHSTSKTLKSGVPQGSVLGPILFSLFVSPIGNICRKHNIQFHNYADDNQNYITFRPTVQGNKDEKIAQLEACISEIRLWMRTNFLKLNDSKTEVIMFGTHQSLTKVKTKEICVGNTLVEIVEYVRNLGYYMDKELKSKIHINKIVSSCTYILRNIARVRHHLTHDATKTLVQALVLSKMDYCNSLILGAPNYLIQKFQRVQNMACRIIIQSKKNEHITQYLIELHWLKIPQCIIFKILTIMYRCFHGTAPIYLQELVIRKHSHSRLLHSNGSLRLPTVRSRTSQHFHSSFSSMGPGLWNDIPTFIKISPDIQTFKARLKTHLFRESYEL